MKIIRWLLSHTVLIILIVAVIYGYMFWGNLAGKDTPAGKALAYLSHEFVEVEEFIAAVKEKQAGLTAKSSTTEARIAPNIEPSSNVALVPPANTNYRYNTPAPAVQNSAPVPETVQSKQAVPALTHVQQDKITGLSDRQTRSVASDPQAVTTPLAKTAAADKFVSAELEKQLDNVDKQGKVVTASQKNDAIRALWITARKSFYQRNYTLSEQSYQQVIDKTKDNFDAYGELGNVYFNQGKNKQAASAYFEAAAILVRNGQVNRAKSLMGLLRHLDESKAGELKQLIDSSLS